MARIVQHETDHLFGTCFYQRAVASLTKDYENVLTGMKEQFEEDLKKGLEPTQEQFQEYVAKLESERC